MSKKRRLFVLLTAFVCAPLAHTETVTIEKQLQSLLTGSTPLDALTVTYTDLQGLWGGLSMTIHGSGKVEQKVIRVKADPPRKLTKADLQNLIKLLLELKTWEQRVPERIAVPDEGRASLRIQVGPASSKIWEWYNDMKANDRLIQIRESMQQLAWGKRETGGTTNQ